MSLPVRLTVEQRAYVFAFDRMLRRGWRCNPRLEVMLGALALVVRDPAYARMERRTALRQAQRLLARPVVPELVVGSPPWTR